MDKSLSLSVAKKRALLFNVMLTVGIALNLGKTKTKTLITTLINTQDQDEVFSGEKSYFRVEQFYGGRR